MSFVQRRDRTPLAHHGTEGLLTARLTRFLAQRLGAGSASRWHAWVHLRTGGRLLGTWFGAPMLVLEVRGRTSGQVYAIPLVFAELDGSLIVAAANGGADRAPQWLANLAHAGRAEVTLRGSTSPVAPEVCTGADADRAFARLVRCYPPAAHYEGLAGRPVPVVRLRRQPP